MTSVEQMARDLLEQAIKDGLVAESQGKWDDADPQCRSSGELAGVANMLNGFLVQAVGECDGRWQRAIGTSLDDAEEQAEALFKFEREQKERRKSNP